MGETIRARVLLAKFPDDTEPCVVAAVDETIWEHWEDADERAWLANGKRTWGMDEATEWREVWVEFAPADLVAAFATPVVRGSVPGGTRA